MIFIDNPSIRLGLRWMLAYKLAGIYFSGASLENMELLFVVHGQPC